MLGNRIRRPRSKSPPRPGQHHVDGPPAAFRADEPFFPIENGNIRAIATHHLDRIGLDLMLAILTPDDDADAGSRGAAERRPSVRRGLQRRRRRAPTLGGAYTFDGGRGARGGSGWILFKTARRT